MIRLADEIVARLRKIKLAIFDADGVLTDGTLYYGPNGEELKAFHTLDGQGLKMLQQSGIELAIISGRSSRALTRRAAEQEILLFQGVQDKGKIFRELLANFSLEAEQSACIGDDVIDLPILIRCGFAATVPHAPDFVQQRVHYITQAAGGRGAVREFCEVIMRGQGTLDPALERYLS